MPRVVLAAADVEDSLPHAPSRPSTSPRSSSSRSSSSPTSASRSARRPSTRRRSSTRSSTGSRRPRGARATTSATASTPNGVSPMSCPGMRGGSTRPTVSSTTRTAAPNAVHLDAREDERQALPQARGRSASKYQFVPPLRRRRSRSSASSAGARSKGRSRRRSPASTPAAQKVAAFVPADPLPVPQEASSRSSSPGCRQLLIVELNYSAQFYKYLRTFVDLPRDGPTSSSGRGGKNLTVAEIENEIAKLARPANGRRR